METNDTSSWSSYSECDCYFCQYGINCKEVEVEPFPFYAPITHPMVYLAQCVHGKKNCRKCNTKPNCFVRAFRRCTNPKCDRNRSQDVSPCNPPPCQEEICANAPNLPTFALWLDAKYKQFMLENSVPCHAKVPEQPFIDHRHPGTCSQQQRRNKGKVSMEFIMPPKSISRAASECCQSSPCCSEDKQVITSRSETATVCVNKSGFRDQQFVKPPVQQTHINYQQKQSSKPLLKDVSCQCVSLIRQTNVETQYELSSNRSCPITPQGPPVITTHETPAKDSRTRKKPRSQKLKVICQCKPETGKKIQYAEPCPDFQKPCPSLHQQASNLAKPCPSLDQPCLGVRPCPSLRKPCPPCPKQQQALQVENDLHTQYSQSGIEMKSNIHVTNNVREQGPTCIELSPKVRNTPSKQEESTIKSSVGNVGFQDQSLGPCSAVPVLRDASTGSGSCSVATCPGPCKACSSVGQSPQERNFIHRECHCLHCHMSGMTYNSENTAFLRKNMLVSYQETLAKDSRTRKNPSSQIQKVICQCKPETGKKIQYAESSFDFQKTGQQNQYVEPCPDFQKPCPSLHQQGSNLAEICPSLDQPCLGVRLCPSLRNPCPPCPKQQETLQVETDSQTQYSQSGLEMKSNIRVTSNLREQGPTCVEPSPKVRNTPPKQEESTIKSSGGNVGFQDQSLGPCSAVPVLRDASTGGGSCSVATCPGPCKACSSVSQGPQERNFIHREYHCLHRHMSGMTYDSENTACLRKNMLAPQQNVVITTGNGRCSVNCPFYASKILSQISPKSQTTETVQLTSGIDDAAQTSRTAIRLDRLAVPQCPLFIRVVGVDKLSEEPARR